MIKQRKGRNRLLIVLFVAASVTCGVALMLRAMSDSIVFFYTTSELVKITAKKDVRVGGLVKDGSIYKIDAATIIFVITDLTTDLKVRYKGVLPTLFRENQGIVALGSMEDNLFVAKELLTKHDENYSPPTHDLKGK